MKFNKGDKVVIEIKGVLPNDNGDPVYIAGDGYKPVEQMYEEA